MKNKWQYSKIGLLEKRDKLNSEFLEDLNKMSWFTFLTLGKLKLKLHMKNLKDYEN
jgi:hypothetical protein